MGSANSGRFLSSLEFARIGGELCEATGQLGSLLRKLCPRDEGKDS